MKAPAFEYARPTSVDAAVELLSAVEDSKVIAGGQSLVPLLALRLAEPTLLVDVGGIERLRTVDRSASALQVGAGVTQSALRSGLNASGGICALVRDVIDHVGHEPIRNRGTIGGSLCHADPAAEWPALLLCCAGEVTAERIGGSRVITAEDLFVGPLMTCLDEDEMLTSIRLPIAGFTTWGFCEIARRVGDFALAGSIVVAQGDRYSVEQCRVVAFGCAATPTLLDELPTHDTTWEELLAGVLELNVDKGIQGDFAASQAARAHLARTAIRRALLDARARTIPEEQS